jgi:methyl-accepting chemotaxis protein
MTFASTMVAKLGDIISKVRENVSSLVGASDQLSSTAQSISQGASEQAASGQVAAEEIGRLATGSVDLAGKAGKLLETIVPSIQKTSDLVLEITSASAEQNSGAGQINRAIGQISQAVAQNAATSEELASTSEEVNAQALELQATMEFFTLAGGGSPARLAVKPGGRPPIRATAPARKGPKADPAESDFSRF